MANELFTAVRSKDFEKIKNLLSTGIEMDGSDSLILAIHLGNIKIVKLLVAHGADINLAEVGNGDTPLMRAAWKGFDNIVKFLLEEGAQINKVNKYGWTALMLAATEGRVKVVKHLLEKGADPKIVGFKPEGVTALSTAQTFNHINVVELLTQQQK